MNRAALHKSIGKALLSLAALVPDVGASGTADRLGDVEAYVQSQGTTGFMIVQDRRILLERHWPPGPGSGEFQAMFAAGRAPDGSLLEDVASQQKSFVAVLAGIATDKKLLDVTKPVNAYLGAGWSRASPEQEAQIAVLNILQMNSGLNLDMEFEAPPGDRFRYNTPAYAIMLRVLPAAARQPLEQLTREWLTDPLGMVDTNWRKRGAALAAAGNAWGLVTTLHDEATLGQMILDRGLARNGRRIVSEAELQAMFESSPTNPAYGRLWWLNGRSHVVLPVGRRLDGPWLRAAPPDMVAALGFNERRLYVVPGARLVVVRLGQHAPDPAFDQQLWLRLSKALDLDHSVSRIATTPPRTPTYNVPFGPR